MQNMTLYAQPMNDSCGSGSLKGNIYQKNLYTRIGLPHHFKKYIYLKGLSNKKSTIKSSNIFGEYETEFKKSSVCESGAQGGFLIFLKTEGRKSRDTPPLISNCCFLSLIHVMDATEDGAASRYGPGFSKPNQTLYPVRTSNM
jgi:hypothetical protein